MKMKKLVLSTLLLGATAGMAQAQTEAGKLLMGGNINYSHFDSDNDQQSTSSTSPLSYKTTNKSSQFNFNPQLGFFLADHLAVGINFNIGFGKQSGSTEDYLGTLSPSSYASKGTSKNFGLGPFVRYYKMLGDKFALYGQLGSGYQYSEQKSTTDNPNVYSYRSTAKSGFAALTPGIVFFPTSKIGLEVTVGSLSYYRGKQTSYSSAPSYNNSTSRGTTSSFGASFGVSQLALGAYFYLGRS